MSETDFRAASKKPHFAVHSLRSRRGAMTIQYDAGEMTGWCGLPRLLLRWNGTVLHGAVLGPMFWLSNLLHVAMLILSGKIPIYIPSNSSDTDAEWVPWDAMEIPALDWRAAVISLSLLFFFIVFYGNSSYQRFFQLYGHTVGIGGTTMEWVYMVKSQSARLVEPGRSTARWNATRYVLAATHVLYYSLHGEGLSDDEWEVIGSRGLLSQTEMEETKAYKGMKPFLVLSWALAEAEGILVAARPVDLDGMGLATTAMREEILMSQFREVVFKFRGHCGQIVNLLKQPVPFPYFHLLNVILAMQLLLIGYGLATFRSLAWGFSLVIMVFITVVLLGMRGLAVQLSNPFGNDSVDFEIEQFMAGAYNNAKAHLSAKDHPPLVTTKPAAKGLINPLAAGTTEEQSKRLAAAWKATPTDVGKIADDDRVFTKQFADAVASCFSGAATTGAGVAPAEGPSPPDDAKLAQLTVQEVRLAERESRLAEKERYLAEQAAYAAGFAAAAGGSVGSGPVGPVASRRAATPTEFMYPYVLPSERGTPAARAASAGPPLRIHPAAPGMAAGLPSGVAHPPQSHQKSPWAPTAATHLTVPTSPQTSSAADAHGHVKAARSPRPTAAERYQLSDGGSLHL